MSFLQWCWVASWGQLFVRFAIYTAISLLVSALAISLTGCTVEDIHTRRTAFPDAAADASVDSITVDSAPLAIDAGTDSQQIDAGCNTGNPALCCSAMSDGNTLYCHSGVCKRCGRLGQDCCPRECLSSECADPLACMLTQNSPQVYQCVGCGTRGLACCPPIGEYVCDQLPCRCIDGSTCGSQDRAFICM